MTAPNESSPPSAVRSRQRKKLLILATCLIGAGLLILFFLERLPTPLRIVSGLGDIVAGCVLLVLARQKFRPEPNSSAFRKA